MSLQKDMTLNERVFRQNINSGPSIVTYHLSYHFINILFTMEMWTSNYLWEFQSHLLRLKKILHYRSYLSNPCIFSQNTVETQIRTSDGSTLLQLQCLLLQDSICVCLHSISAQILQSTYTLVHFFPFSLSHDFPKPNKTFDM